MPYISGNLKLFALAVALLSLTVGCNVIELPFEVTETALEDTGEIVAEVEGAI